MYDWPQLQVAYQEYWSLIRDDLRNDGLDAPDELSRYGDESASWLDPELVLSQSCSMPYRCELHDKVILVGTPDFGVSECPAGYYRSAIVVRADDPRTNVKDFRDSIFAFNSENSQSGFVAAYFHTIERRCWFSRRSISGGHRNSARMVVERRADIASLDAVSWRHMRRYDAFAADLRVLEWTIPTPGLPYICARGYDRVRLFAAIEKAIQCLSVEANNKLGLRGLIYLPPDTYLNLPII